MGRNNIAGAWGEAVAAEYLKTKRYKLQATGYRCRYGEIDLIVSNREFLVFVEVKLRKNAKFAAAAEHVDYHKQNRIRTTASLYLSEHPTQLRTRFDVIEIYAPDVQATRFPEIYHTEDAFE